VQADHRYLVLFLFYQYYKITSDSQHRITQKQYKIKNTITKRALSKAHTSAKAQKSPIITIKQTLAKRYPVLQGMNWEGCNSRHNAALQCYSCHPMNSVKLLKNRLQTSHTHKLQLWTLKHTHTHSVLTAIFPGEPGLAGCLLKQKLWTLKQLDHYLVQMYAFSESRVSGSAKRSRARAMLETFFTSRLMSRNGSNVFDLELH